MSKEQIYTRVERDAERRNGWQVRLKLNQETHRFVLTHGIYSSDWGDRHEQSTEHTGGYMEDQLQVICKAERRYTIDILTRHEEGDGHDNRDWVYSEETFTFLKQGSALRCPIDFQGALHQEMSQDADPIVLWPSRE